METTTREARIKGASSLRRERQKQELRQKILDVASELFLEKGYEKFSLRQVAERIGYSPTTIYLYFQNKDDLLMTAVQEGFDGFDRRMIEIASTTPDSLARIEKLGRAYIDFARMHPAMYQLMFSAERLDMNNPVLRQAADASFSGLVAAINENRSEAIAETRLTLDQAADIVRVWSLVHGFAMLLIDGRLQGVLKYLPVGTDATMLLDAMLRSMPMRPGSR